MSRESICIFGAPTNGKSYSMKSLSQDKDMASKVLYVNADSKGIPWFGGNNFTTFTLKCPTMLPRVISDASKAKNPDGTPRFTMIVVDTITRVMESFNSRYISSKEPKYEYDDNKNVITDMNYIATTKVGSIDGMQAWGRSATLFKDIMDAGTKSECQMVYMSHMTLKQRPDGTFSYESPIQGSIGNVGLAAWFSIAMVARNVSLEALNGEPDSHMLNKTESRKGTGHKYVFQVEKTPDTTDYPIRSIDGMYPENMHFIDNDLGKLFAHLDKLYAGEDTGLVYE